MPLRAGTRGSALALAQTRAEPALLVVAAIGSMTLPLTEVLPQFVPMFEQSGARLHASTQFLTGAGDFIWKVMGIAVAGIVTSLMVAILSLNDLAIS
jgi:general secretion pathway protein F